MASDKITVAELAVQLNLSADKLLEHFKAANMRVKDAEQEISALQQQKIRQYLAEHGSDVPATSSKTISRGRITLERKTSTAEETASEREQPKKITLRRQTTSQLKVTGVQGDKKTVNVTVVKKRTYVKRSVAQADEAKEQDALISQEDIMQQPQAEITATPAPHVEQKGQAVEAPAQIEPAKIEPVTETVVQSTEAAHKEHKKKLHHEEPVKVETIDDEEEKKKKKKKVKAAEDDKSKARKVDLRHLEVESEEDQERERIRARFENKPIFKSKFRQEFARPTKPIVHEVEIPEEIKVSDLAQKMSIKAAEVIKVLMKMGMMASINQAIDRDTATLVVEEMGHKAIAMQKQTIEEKLQEEVKINGEMLPRPPVVTIMGHVDHGKTSLLDYIRRTKVAASEAGGITQNIGAYHVETPKGVITFLDTPGHEAFTAMRARGAKVTDLVVLVVAGDDGVMPQTQEAIRHAKAAGVPIVVAVNKMDKPEADPERIKVELSQNEVIADDWGGDSMFCYISAKTGQGIDELLDAILLQSEVLELKAAYEGPAQGIVVEARLDKGRGVIASVLVQQGTLKVGDMLLAGFQYGRVRALLDERGRRVDQAGPSIPVEVLGLEDLPHAGDEFLVVQNERKAREVANFRQNKYREEKLAKQQSAKLENIFSRMEQGQVNTLNIVLKADVLGSLEALGEALNKLSTDEVKVEIISKGVGAITGSDANLALASEAIIIAFNVRADNVAREVINNQGVDVHYHSVIYDAIDEVKRALTGMLAPEFKEEIVGLAEVRDVFRSSKFGAIAGCMVIEGSIKRNKPIRVLRDNVVVFEGELESLRRFKDDVNEVKKGTECGIGVKSYNDIKPGDQIEVFDKIQVTRTL